MSRFVAAALAVLSVTALPGLALAETGTEFASPTGGYRARFPAEPKEGTKPGAQSTIHLAYLNGSTGGFSVSWFELLNPAGKTAATIVDDLICVDKGSADPLHLLSTRPATLAGQPAQEARWEKSGRSWHHRVLLSGKRVYTVTVAWKKGQPEPAESAAFFDSFQLLSGSGTEDTADARSFAAPAP